MNLINKILLLAILFFLINHLTGGKIIDSIKRFYNNNCKSLINIENFTNPQEDKCITLNAPNIPYQHQLDFPYINQNDPNNLDEESYSLYKFLNDMISINQNTYELTKSNSERNDGSALENEIFNRLNTILNCKEFKFSNLKFLDKIYYYNNPRGKEIEPFKFSADVSYKNNFIGSVIVNIECFIRHDMFYHDPMDSGYLSILNVKLLSRTRQNITQAENNTLYKLKQNSNYLKVYDDAHKKNNDLTNKMVESFENHFVDRHDFDDLFIKTSDKSSRSQPNDTPTIINNFVYPDSENSLIPSVIEFSE